MESHIVYMHTMLRYCGHWWTGTNRYVGVWGFRHSYWKNIVITDLWDVS